MAEIVGENVEDLALQAFGGGAALLTSNLLFPHIKGMVGSLLTNATIAGLAQAATTVGAGVAEGEVIGAVADRRRGEKWKSGAVLVGFVQAVGAVLPGIPYGVTAANPSALKNPFAAPAALPPATQAGAVTSATQSFTPSRVQGI